MVLPSWPRTLTRSSGLPIGDQPTDEGSWGHGSGPSEGLGTPDPGAIQGMRGLIKGIKGVQTL